MTPEAVAELASQPRRSGFQPDAHGPRRAGSPTYASSASTSLAIALLTLALPGVSPGQPPLPPTERPKVVGPVASVAGAETIALQTGATAPLAPTVRVNGAASLPEVMPGDLVELLQDENGLVTEITVLPRLVQRRLLVQVLPADPPVSRFWWQHEGRDFPDSIYTAEASLPLQLRSVVFEATAAYVPSGQGEPVTFAVLGEDDTVLFERRLLPGEAVPVRCPLGKTPVLKLRCRRADGGSPNPAYCVWGSPSVVLQEVGLFPLKPAMSDDLAAKLADAVAGVAPGVIAVARPRLVGLAPETAVDWQQDLLIALGRRLKVAGIIAVETGPELTDQVRAAATALGAGSVLAAELRYGPDGSQADLTLADVEGKETLAHVEAVLKP